MPQLLETILPDMLSQGLNAISTSRMNKKNRKFAQRMYNQQRQDSLADWNMMNEYNSPAAQMQRLKDAGLNPNLVYGHGATAMSTSQPRSSSPSSVPQQAPQFDLGSTMSRYFNTQVQQAQMTNMVKQGEVLEMEKRLKEAQEIKALADTKMTNFRRSQGERLADSNAELLYRTIEKKIQDTKFTHMQNIRAEKMNAQQIAESASRILTLEVGRKLTYANIGKVAQEVEIMLYNRYNIQPKQAAMMAAQYERLIIDAMNRQGGKPVDVTEGIPLLQEVLKMVIK